MRLNVFNGGLHTRPAAHLIKPNESRSFVNVDNSTGILTPIKDKTEAITGAKKYAYFSTSENAWQFSDTPVDYADFQERLYYTDRTSEPKKKISGTEYKLGIEPPATEPTLEAKFAPEPVDLADVTTTKQTGPASTLPINTELNYKFVRYKFVDGVEVFTDSEVLTVTLTGSENEIEFRLPSATYGTARSGAGDTWDLFRLVGGYYRRVGQIDLIDDEIITDKFYTSAGNNPLALMLSGVFQYAITYYNSVHGIESGPVISSEVTLEPGFVSISNIPVSSDPQVDKKRIYRIGGTYSEFLLVAEIDNSTTVFADDIPDLEIPGDLLTTGNYLAAPNGLKYLTEAYAMLFGALDDKLRFTPIGQPDAWPELYFIDFPAEITGISVVANGIIVYTRYRSYLITGTGPSTLSKQTLSSDQGCTSHDSIVYVGGAALWTSTDGVCSSNGSEPKVITKAKLGKINFDVVNAVLHDQEYLLQLADGLTFIVDFDDNILKYQDLDIESVAIGNDKKYGYKDGLLHELESGSTDLKFEYLSAEFIGSTYTRRKAYKSVYITSEGDITAEIYIDGSLVNTVSFSGTLSIHEIKIKESAKNGNKAQIGIKGTGIVYEIVFDEESANV